MYSSHCTLNSALCPLFYHLCTLHSALYTAGRGDQFKVING